MTEHITTRWMVPPHAKVTLEERDASSTDGAPGDRVATESAIAPLHQSLLLLQERLWAEGTRSLLVVLQGIDASGKDGTISHVFRGLNPLGTRVAAFKVPTPEEAAHDFLWRIHAHCPAAGEIAFFNRSHYEDVLVARVHHLVSPHIWQERYAHINSFESLLSESGTKVVKVFLHVSKDEQLERLEERVHDKTKQWKVHTSDFDERKLWDAYVEAFEAMLEQTSTTAAPWYIVPADHKWYRNWAVSTILMETLREMDPKYPKPEIPESALGSTR